MIIYNVTVNIDDDVHDEWLHWMKEAHIPDVMSTGLFLENKICKILAESEGGVSYSIQYLCKDMKTYDQYEEIFASKLRREHTEKYGGKFVAFRTLLEVVSVNKG
jgi:hypothetical protein